MPVDLTPLTHGEKYEKPLRPLIKHKKKQFRAISKSPIY